MNYRYIGFALFFTLTFTSLSVSAQERDRERLIDKQLFRPVGVDVRERVREYKEKAVERGLMPRERTEAKRASQAERRVEIQRGVAERKVENTTRVMQATIGRLEQIAERIESRLEKLSEMGGDTSEAEAYLLEARIGLSEATGFVSTLSTIDLSGEKEQDNFMRVRSAAAEARKLIRSAHQSLMFSVRSLAGVQGDISSSSSDMEPEEEIEKSEN